jgi:hypothetical protein
VGFEVLQIAREHSSLAAGRQRKDLDQIHPPVLDDGVLELLNVILNTLKPVFWYYLVGTKIT